MRVLVTGANGLLGQKLVQLLQQDDRVHLVATARSNLVQSLHRGEFHLLDVTQGNVVEQVVGFTKPDVIIHTAAMTNVDRCEMDHEGCTLQNVTAVKNLIIACEKHAVHLIHISTDFIFDGSHGPLDESAVPAPVNFYGESKLQAEKLLQQSAISWCILRTVLVYGITKDLSRSNIVLWVKKNLEERKKISVVNDQWRTPTLAEDLAMGCYQAAIKKAKGIYHVSGKDFMTPYDIAIRTAKFFQLDQTLIQPTDSTHFKQAAVRPLKTGFVIHKAEKELGYAPHSFEEGLAIVSSQL